MSRAVGLLALALAVAGCTTTSPNGTDSIPSPSADSVSVLACEPITLLGPDGRSVFLSGTWIGTGDPNAVPKPSVFYLAQANDCLAWVGLSAEEEEALGGSWIEAFHGTIGSDFVISGLWDEVSGEGIQSDRGAITVQIEFVRAGEMYETQLRLLDSIGDAHLVKSWVRKETTP